MGSITSSVKVKILNTHRLASRTKPASSEKLDTGGKRFKGEIEADFPEMRSGSFASIKLHPVWSANESKDG